MNSEDARIVVVERRSSWESVTDSELFVGRISSSGWRFPQYLNCSISLLDPDKQTHCSHLMQAILTGALHVASKMGW